MQGSGPDRESRIAFGCPDRVSRSDLGSVRRIPGLGQDPLKSRSDAQIAFGSRIAFGCPDRESRSDLGSRNSRRIASDRVLQIAFFPDRVDRATPRYPHESCIAFVESYVGL